MTLAHQAKKGRDPQQTIPQPFEDLGSLYRAVLALKERFPYRPASDVAPSRSPMPSAAGVVVG